MVISASSFPAHGCRDELTKGQLRQLRDAMIFEAQVREGRHVLVTTDASGFINQGRRLKPQQLGRTRILTPTNWRRSPRGTTWKRSCWRLSATEPALGDTNPGRPMQNKNQGKTPITDRARPSSIDAKLASTLPCCRKFLPGAELPSVEQLAARGQEPELDPILEQTSSFDRELGRRGDPLRYQGAELVLRSPPPNARRILNLTSPDLVMTVDGAAAT